MTATEWEVLDLKLKRAKAGILLIVCILGWITSPVMDPAYYEYGVRLLWAVGIGWNGMDYFFNLRRALAEAEFRMWQEKNVEAIAQRNAIERARREVTWV